MKRGQLDDLLAFATIARARSFRRAAAELNVSPSALSHTMRSLETRLGVRLLARTTRSVAPTPAGERLLESVESALEQVESGLGAMGQWRGDPAGAIRITTAHYAAHHILAPALPALLRENPRITVEICVEGRLADLVRDGFDAGIRWGEIVEQDMVAVRIGPNTRLILVGAPAYFERHPRPQSSADLERHNCINYRNVSSGGIFPWTLQCADGKEVRGRATRSRPQGLVRAVRRAAYLRSQPACVTCLAGTRRYAEMEALRRVRSLRKREVHEAETPALAGCARRVLNRGVYDI